MALRAGFTRGWWFPVRGRPRDPGGDRVRELLGDPEARLRDAVLPGGDGRGWGWRGPSLTTLTGIVLLVALAQGLALSLARSQPRVGRIAVPAVPVAALLVLALVRPVPLPFRHEAGAVGLAGRGDRAALLIERHRLVGLADVTVPVASGPLPAGVLREPAPPRGREIPWEALGSGARAGEASLRPGESRVLEIRREAPLPGPPLSVGEGIRSPLGIPLARAWGVRAGRAHPLGSLAPRAPVPDPLPGPGLPLEAIGVGEEGWVRAALDRAAAWAEALAPGERALVGIGAPADTLRLEARAVESRTAPTVWILLLD